MKFASEHSRAILHKDTLEYLANRWGIKEVYSIVERELDTNTRVLKEIFEYLLSDPGKGLRALLVKMSASFGNERTQRDINYLAAGIEMLHLATLIHDDVIDSGEIRRGKETVNSRWSNVLSVLTGDYLYGKSVGIIQYFGAEAAKMYADIIENMVEGEIKQLDSLFNTSIDIKTYLSIIENKTAVFFSSCCVLGASIAGADIKSIKLLECFGRKLGMSFQIQDDVLDWCSTEERAGKQVYRDLPQGVITLPVLRMLKVSSYREELVRIIKKGEFSEEEMQFILNEIRNTGSLQFAQATSVIYKKEAYNCLEKLPRIGAKEDLKSILNVI